MNILGLSFDYHDSAAALIMDGKVVAAAHEERFTREKNTAAFPRNAIAFCLKEGKLSPADIDHVVFYERPIRKLDRMLRTYWRDGGLNGFGQALGRWLAERRLEVPQRIAECGIPANRVRFVEHHQSHAGAAFFCSPFDEATVITLDGVGEHETATISIGRGCELKKLDAVHFPHSIGLFYSAFTAFLGFEVNEGEYKVMGMAAYGRPTLAKELLKEFDLRGDGTFAIDQRYFQFRQKEAVPFSQALIDRLGPPRVPESSFDESASHYLDIAASVQACTEDVILHIVDRAVKRTGIRNVAMAGGVTLNSVANGRIQRELGCRLYVHPAAGDAGGALGAALYQYHGVLRQPRRGPLTTPYLGSHHDDDAVADAITTAGLRSRYIADADALLEHVAERLAGQRVVGWFQGRAEWGPRSLGARSILASPTDPEMKRIVNEKIKFRELFRPFAPSVPAERAGEFFQVDKAESAAAPEHFMLAVCKVRPEHRDTVPAVVHVDDTARIHFVDKGTNPLFHGLLTKFGEKTNVPVLLNTSFNLRGQPIVDSPDDAIAVFLTSGIDCLVMGHHVVEKNS